MLMKNISDLGIPLYQMAYSTGNYYIVVKYLNGKIQVPLRNQLINQVLV